MDDYDKLLELPEEELAKEISRRVWEKQGNCVHRNTHRTMLQCDDCGLMVKLHPVPDIRDPNVFWPVARELYQMGYQVAYNRIEKRWVVTNAWLAQKMLTTVHEHEWAALAIAWLKAKDN